VVGLIRILGRLHVCVGGICACAVSLAAAPALADGTDPAYPGSVLHVSVTGPRVAGQVLTIVATGTNAPDSLGLPIDYGLDVILVDLSKLPGPCQQGYNAELTNVTDNPQAGRLVTFEALNEGTAGPFKISLPFTPGGSGQLLVCAYSVFITDDAAYASTQVQIAPKGGKPVNIKRPQVTRSGNRLTCSRGSWSGRPSSYSYRWMVGGNAVASDRKARLTVTHTLRGHGVRCAVIARNAAGSSTATSRPLAVP